MDDRVLVAAMVAYIEGHLVEPIGADDLALRSGYSLNRLRQKFFNVTGDTPSGYLRKRRLTEAAKEILGCGPPAEVALKYGYSSQDNFITAFRSYFGVTPSEIARIEVRYRRFIQRMREAYTIMELANLKQPPLSATLMGCLKGVADYFDADLSVPMLYGLTGHAFLINIHKDLCPSSPYVWNKKRFWELLAGLGMEMVAEYGLGRDSSESERHRVEERLRGHLDCGELCMLDFLEHQLVGGYDEKGFLMLRPWNCEDPSSEVREITFGTWEQCLRGEGWAHVSVLAKRPMRKSIPEAARDALAFAIELLTDPRRHEVEGYRIGQGAYESWIAGVERGLGSSHGHWWSGMVWTECRQQAAAFFGELGELTDSPVAAGACSELAKLYAGIAESLGAASAKDLPKSEQLRLLRAAREAERGAPAALQALAEAV